MCVCLKHIFVHCISSEGLDDMDDTDETVFETPVTKLVQSNGTVIPNGTSRLPSKKSKLKSVPEETVNETRQIDKWETSLIDKEETSQRSSKTRKTKKNKKNKGEILNNGHVYTDISLDDSDYEIV